jgi:hypothetical protein
MLYCFFFLKKFEEGITVKSIFRVDIMNVSREQAG